jgi:hypothetical protein
MEPYGSSRRTIALYGGDSSIAGFIPHGRKLSIAVKYDFGDVPEEGRVLDLI